MFLLIIHMLLGTDCRIEEPDYANADRFYVAIAKSQEFFTFDRCGKAEPKVDVHATPAKGEKIGEIRWARAGQVETHYCIPFIYLSQQKCPRGVVPLMEDGYEESAFVVVERKGRWVRIRLDEGTGWILLSKDDEVVPYGELVLGDMAELTDDWDGRIYAQPGGRSRKLSGVTRPPVSVEDSRRVDGKLWFRVRVLAESPCEAREPRELATGWVRGYSSRRQPTVRHFSRGC